MSWGMGAVQNRAMGLSKAKNVGLVEGASLAGSKYWYKSMATDMTKATTKPPTERLTKSLP